MLRKQQIALILVLTFSSGFANEVRVAVASNFTKTIKEISKQFEEKTNIKVILSFGSTGRHYAQIRNGAPFDIFLAANVKHPKLLEDEKVIIPNSRFTYAIGKIVLWSPRKKLFEQGKGIDDMKNNILKSGNSYHIAIANPKLAPYGKAAQDVMKSLGVWNSLQNKIIRGENVSQTFSFVKTGNAELGFVALSHIKYPNSDINNIKGYIWLPPQSLYTPIEQQAVLLKNTSISRKFVEFIKGAEGHKIIRSYGYDI